ncbi:hypothetical protein LCGC14_0220970 [marine sediment metagenome]|uniref:Uncharacterized protein n=1 Tax=marine sediment metagenome TaxID=412755 RepID=A0A0F9UHS8_9ZZZZ
MSRYCTVRTEFMDGRALIEALVETGHWTAEQIEIHHEPQHLLGYKGDRRKETANIIIRSKHVGRLSNDIGFAKGEDGNYVAIISEYDSGRYGKKWIGQLTGNYAYHRVRREQESRGRNVSRERGRDGRQRVTITGYR